MKLPLKVNQFYNITLIISEGDKIIQDTISHSQSVTNRYRILREAVYANETVQWDIESFDLMQKYFFDEIDETLDFVTEQTELIVDLLYRTCWTFETQVVVSLFISSNDCFSSRNISRRRSTFVTRATQPLA